MYYIFNVLCEFGQCTEETFVFRNLIEMFPDLAREDLVKYSEDIDENYVGGRDGTNYFLFKDSRHAFKLIESIRFRKLQEQYAYDPDVSDLHDIISDLAKIANEDDHELSLEDKIEIVKRALNARGPKGLIFELTPEKEIKES
jgi:hypothetical protein